jgi:hypothetical protein
VTTGVGLSDVDPHAATVTPRSRPNNVRAIGRDAMRAS